MSYDFMSHQISVLFRPDSSVIIRKYRNSRFYEDILPGMQDYTHVLVFNMLEMDNKAIIMQSKSG